MPEVQDDIIMEDIGEFEQDPKPKMSESHKRKLDSIIVQMDKQGASKDEILAIVEDYKKRYSTKPLVTPSKPQQEKQEVKEFMPGVTFGGQQPQFGKNKSVIQQVDPNKPGQISALINRPKAIANAGKAQKKLQEELHANDDVVETMIRNQRMNVAAQNFNAPTSEVQATGMQQFNEPIVRPNEVPVTLDEIALFKSDTEANEGAARNLFKEVTDRKPEKKKEIESSVYRLDAVRNAGNNDARFEKIEKNAKGIEKGELIYNITGGQLLKPEGVVGSLLTGWKQKSQLFDDFSFFNNRSDEEITAELERRRTEYDPDEPIPIPKHKVGELSQMLGSMPVKSMVAGTAVSAVGLPEAAPFVAGAVGAADFYQMGYAGTLQNVYYQMRDEGKSEQEALQIARTQAQKEGAIDAVMGGAMSVAGMRIGAKPVNFSPGYRAAATSFLKSAGKEGAFQSLLGAGGELSKNLLAQEAGIKRETGANVLQAIESNFLLTVGMGAAAKLGKGISSVKYKSILNGLSKVNENLLEGNIVNEVNAGRLTEKQAENIRNEVKAYKELDSQIPENITEEARIDIQKKIERRTELENEMETKNKAFHPEIKEKIAKIDEEIVELSKQKEKKEKEAPEIKEAKLLIDEALDEGVMTDVYGAMAKENPEGFMKFVADQSFGRTEDGTIHGLGNTESQMRQEFGDAIVERAKEMFPLVEKKSSISVMMPDEVKKPDVVEAKVSEPVIAETPVQETVVESEAPPAQPQPEMTGITHEKMNKLAAKLGLDEYQADPETKAQWDIQATERFAKDPDALNKLINKLRNGEHPDKVETRMMIMHMADLEARYNKNPTPELLNELKRTKDLYNIAGREQAKSFVARQGERPVEETLSDFHMRDVDYNKGAPLTEQQTAQSTKEFQEISAAKAALEEKVAKLEADQAAKKAEEAIKKEQKAAKKSEKKDYKSERKQIIDDIKEKLRKSRGDTTATIVPYAKELIAIAPDVAKLVRNLVEEGIDKLPAIIKIVHDEIKEIIPQVTEKDVHDIIAGEYNEKKPKRTDVAEKLYDLKEQAKLINKLEALEAGIQPKTEKQKRRRNQEIEDLRKKIKELQDDTKTDAQKLAAIKSRTKSEIAKLEEQLKNNNFAPEEKPSVELDEEAIKLKDQLIELRRLREYRLQKQEYENQSTLKKVWDYWGRGLLDLRRAVGTAFDFSVPFRQALPVTINPRYAKETGRAFKEMFAQWADKKRYSRWWDDLHESGELKTMQDDGLPLTPPDQLGITKREEEFRTRLVQDIPIVGKGVEMSNQAASGYLNTMRVDLYKKFSAMLQDKGITRENNPEAYKTMAHHIGNLTGRGELLQALKSGEGLLGDVFFGPRLMAAKFNLLNPKRYFELPPEIRKSALWDLSIRVGMYTTIGALLKASGWSVSLNPDDPDFLKLKDGDTKYDITGGEAVYVRTALRILNAAYERVTGEQKSGLKAAEKAGRSGVSFFRNKLAPTPAYLVDALMGKKPTGEPFDPADAARIYPMWIDDIVDDWKQDGPASILTAGVPSIFGIGVQTYVPKEQKEAGAKGSGRSKKPKRPSRK